MMRANFAIFCFLACRVAVTEISYVLDGYLVCAFSKICAAILDCESCCGLAMNVVFVLYLGIPVLVLLAT